MKQETIILRRNDDNSTMDFKMTIRTNKNTFLSLFTGFVDACLSPHTEIFFRRFGVMKSKSTKTPIISTYTTFASILLDKSIFYTSSFNSIILCQFFSILFSITNLVFFTTFFTSVSKSKWICGIFMKIGMWFNYFTTFTFSFNWVHIQ